MGSVLEAMGGILGAVVRPPAELLVINLDSSPCESFFEAT